MNLKEIKEMVMRTYNNHNECTDLTCNNCKFSINKGDISSDCEVLQNNIENELGKHCMYNSERLTNEDLTLNVAKVEFMKNEYKNKEKNITCRECIFYKTKELYEIITNKPYDTGYCELFESYINSEESEATHCMYFTDKYLYSDSINNEMIKDVETKEKLPTKRDIIRSLVDSGGPSVYTSYNKNKVYSVSNEEFKEYSRSHIKDILFVIGEELKCCDDCTQCDFCTNPSYDIFLHIKFSNDGGYTFTENEGKVFGKYIGHYKDNKEIDIENPDLYNWKFFSPITKHSDRPINELIDDCKELNNKLHENSNNNGKMEEALKRLDEANYEDDYDLEQLEIDNNTKLVFMHVRYSDDGGITFTSRNGLEEGKYVGYLVDCKSECTANPEDFVWELTDLVLNDPECKFMQEVTGKVNDMMDELNGEENNQEEDEAPTIWKIPERNNSEIEMMENMKQNLHHHTRYSDDGGITFTANKGMTPGKYLGVCTNYSAEASLNPKDYDWVEILWRKNNDNI